MRFHMAVHLFERGEDLTVDLRDAVGERLHLSNGFRRDGVSLSPLNTTFPVHLDP
jgi:hypothetical protein